MSIKQEYNIEEINCYHDTHKLCIGFIVECKSGCEYGIVYQYKDESNTSECRGSGLYYFRKDTGFYIPSKSMISFIKDFSKSWKRNFEVSNIELIEDYEVYVITSEEERTAYYNSSSTKVMEKMMESASKFLVVYKDEDDITGQLYYPVIDYKQGIIRYYFFTACTYLAPQTVFESYAYIKANEEFIKYPKVTSIKDKIDAIFGYVNSLDLENILGYFKVTEGGYFQSRPGRDDHFHYTKNRLCSSSDIYLNQLTKLGSEITEYYSCQGRDEEDFANENIEETKALRKEIEKKYDKGEHTLFLLKDYLSQIEKIHEDTQIAIKNLSSFIKEGETFLFESYVESLSGWQELIESHNKF